MRTNLLCRYVLLLAILSGTIHGQEKYKDASITVTIDFNRQQQTIHNIGTSFCWYAEEIGKDYPLEKRNMIASLLFSKDMMPDGTPKGIGVSSFRFNIGAGSAEQGASSQITDPSRRVECFLAPDGSYDWNKQKGYQWFLKRANQYKVENLIAFLNSPPVFFNKNGLARKSVKEESTNLKEDHYEAAAGFISTVMKHFDAQNIHFDYLSPVNEPQWEWAETKQEGSPWNNREIAAFAKAIDHSFTMNKVRTRILIPEAAKLDFLLSGNGRNQNQIDEFLNPKHPNYVGNLPHLAPVMAGHSYFTDNGNEQIVQTRKAVREKLQAYPPFSYWQSEYCFLGNGYKDGIDKPSAMEVALFLAKIIHTDLVVGNATAWQYWNAIEPTQNLDGIALFYLIAMKPNQSRTDGEFKATKSLYALGQFSRFVRPGMKRLSVARSDQLSDIAAAGKCMISSYVDAASKSLVIIAINLTNHPQALKIKFANCPEKFQVNRLKPYLTTDSPDQNMKALQPFAGGQYSVPARSIVTLVNKLPNVMPEPLNPKV